MTNTIPSKIQAIKRLAKAQLKGDYEIAPDYIMVGLDNISKSEWSASLLYEYCGDGYPNGVRYVDYDVFEKRHKRHKDKHLMSGFGKDIMAALLDLEDQIKCWAAE